MALGCGYPEGLNVMGLGLVCVVCVYGCVRVCVLGRVELCCAVCQLVWFVHVCGGTAHCVRLECNRIGDAGCEALAGALGHVPSLTTLEYVAQ